MRKRVLLLVCAFLLPIGARAQNKTAQDRQPPADAPITASKPAPRFYRYYGVVGAGTAIPLGGGWGDNNAGFKFSPAFNFAGAKKVDDTLSYGLEASYSSGHRNKSIPEMKVRIFSLTPFLRAAFRDEKKTYFGILGAGVYHWTRRPYHAAGKNFSSDSGSSLGINMGGGIIYPLRDALSLGLELRWHHIFAVNSGNLDVEPANNIAPSVFLAYGF